LFSVQQVNRHFKLVEQSGESQPSLLGVLCTLHHVIG